MLKKKSALIFDDICHTCLDLFLTNVALFSNCVFEVKSEVLALKNNQSLYVSFYVKIVALYPWQIWALIFACSESGAVNYCTGLTFQSFGERIKPQQLLTRCKITPSGLLVGVMAISYLHGRRVNSAFLNDSSSTSLLAFLMTRWSIGGGTQKKQECMGRPISRAGQSHEMLSQGKGSDE